MAARKKTTGEPTAKREARRAPAQEPEATEAKAEPKAAKAAKAAKANATDAKATRAPARPGKKKPDIEAIAVDADALPIDAGDATLAPFAAAVRQSGGAVIGCYRDPLGGHPLMLASLPIDAVQPTPFQRDVSPAHVKRLVHAIGKTRRFLDPLIVMRESDGRWLTPNGSHRLTAMRELGARSVVALVVPERSVAYQILALNIEKAHNLRERATEVRRLIVDLAGWARGSEEDFELELEEPSLVTLGFAYEARPRLSGGAYASVLKKVDGWIDGALAAAVEERRRRAAMVLVLDDAVEEAVGRLREKGLTSPYLRAFVVARVNPLRFVRGEPPPMRELFETMAARARKLDPAKITTADLARSGGAADESE